MSRGIRLRWLLLALAAGSGLPAPARADLLPPTTARQQGLGRQDGETTTWKLVYAGNKATVNGTALPTFIPQHHT